MPTPTLIQRRAPFTRTLKPQLKPAAVLVTRKPGTPPSISSAPGLSLSICIALSGGARFGIFFALQNSASRSNAAPTELRAHGARGDILTLHIAELSRESKSLRDVLRLAEMS
jgi:hypothetical protein